MLHKYVLFFYFGIAGHLLHLCEIVGFPASSGGFPTHANSFAEIFMVIIPTAPDGSSIPDVVLSYHNQEINVSYSLADCRPWSS